MASFVKKTMIRDIAEDISKFFKNVKDFILFYVIDPRELHDRNQFYSQVLYRLY